MRPTAEADCVDCGWIQDFSVDLADPADGSKDVDVEGAPEVCPECGSPDIHYTFLGVSKGTLQHRHVA